MEDEFEAPWWHALLRGMAFLLGLVLLSVFLMGLIIGVARLLDSAGSRPMTYTPPDRTETVPPEQQNARTRVPTPYAPQPWPTHPGRATGFGATGSPAAAVAPAAPAKPPTGPVGMSLEAYQAAVAEGKTVFLPNPSGECDLSGSSGAASIRTLETCFAARAAR